MVWDAKRVAHRPSRSWREEKACPSLRTISARAVVAVCALLALGVGEGWAQPDTLWTKTYEGSIQRDGCYRIIPAFDGGFLLGGYQETGAEANDFVMVKVDSACDLQWRQVYRWALHDIPYSIAQTPDSCFLMSGYSDVEGSSGVVAKVDATGELIWTNFYGNDGCRLRDVKVLENGRIVATGNSNGRGFLMMADSDGRSIWQESYYGGFLKRVLKTHDNGYIMAGESLAFGNGDQGYVLKSDSSGKEEWHRDFGSSGGEYFISVVELENDDFVFGGGTDSTEVGTQAFWLVKTTSGGELVWERRYEENYSCRLKDVITLPDGGLMFVGERFADVQRYGDYVAYRLDAEGDVVWNLYFGPMDSGIFYSVLLLEDNSYLFAGEYFPHLGEMSRFTEFWLVRTEPDSFGVSGVRLLDPAFPSLIALDAPYPNPFNSSTTISFELNKSSLTRVEIFDLLGQRLEVVQPSRLLRPGKYSVYWNASGIPAGEYLVRLETPSVTKLNKMMLVK